MGYPSCVDCKYRYVDVGSKQCRDCKHEEDYTQTYFVKKDGE